MNAAVAAPDLPVNYLRLGSDARGKSAQLLWIGRGSLMLLWQVDSRQEEENQFVMDENSQLFCSPPEVFGFGDYGDIK